VSFDFIAPLREQIRALRAQIPGAPQPAPAILGARHAHPPAPHRR
jgi:hypothetical protein